ncbi:TetR/AcrR family transcriptional regulator [Calidifontibacter sp. DB0510]|uniref:TetR/AcrR family transcriptional regulator n=1 Tax=Metallococcus carri TaxID=1656884 RepID=A0A967B2H0_9MICO|nr:TetR/AcrR family transcriptional regulator [Metallococcus carri]NHN56797.1 TetR/AcrR family transcriptional regulator [Metallococcus carri]NOP37826.1 TetR/AcrR family transcriptional regulator [Calidifontibacter sp. DB2511S]
MTDRAPSLVDAALLREPPATARGIRTRATLVAAARTVFERDGFLAARLTDITAEAHCSIGTFYTYFASKEEVFAAVLQEAQDDMMHPGMPHVEDSDEHPEQLLAASHRAYLTAYKRNAKLMQLLEQVATIDPQFARLRRRRARAFIDRNARHIAALQERGMVDPTLDPQLTSACLSAMVSRMAYHVFVLGDRYTMNDLVDTLTRVWVGALRLSPPPSA